MDAVITSYSIHYTKLYELGMKGQFKTIMVTAEGIPERMARAMNRAARDAGIIVIGPATVGGIAPGAFKIANVGGTIENIINSKLHRCGSCGLSYNFV